jgi:hypothetical protein
MVCTYFLNFIISIVAAVYYDHGEKETASAYHLFGCTLFNGMVFFISLYGFYFNTNIEKIAAKFEKKKSTNGWIIINIIPTTICF